MSDKNGTAISSADSGGGDNDNTELIVAVIALIISLLAFIATSLQALQQYYASATGWASCNESVMGKWARYSKRPIRWSEFRLEVHYEVPIIFVAKPDNQRGPLGEHSISEIIKLDGSDGNLKYTTSTKEFDDQRKDNNRQLVHTADNENATWYALLMAIYRMENESRQWQRKKWQREFESSQYSQPCPSQGTHSLVVCMQRKRRTWDHLARALGKPYATTTISHLIEFVAMLGIHWKKFDLDNDRYRAQGNGFAIYGTYMENMGTVFTFEKQGPTWFERNRVISNYNVKKFCFGLVPTIFSREGKLYADEPKDIGNLQLGSHAEIGQTLAEFGCSNKTIDYFRKYGDKSRHTHLFPVAFEILGMIGELMHVRHTAFRMLPNPTVYYWDPNTFSLSLMADEITKSLRFHYNQDSDLKSSSRITKILSPPPAERLKSPLRKLDYLHETIEEFDKYLKQDDLVNIVRIVVCVHFEVVLGILNAEANAPSLDNAKHSQTKEISLNLGFSVRDFDNGSSIVRHRLLTKLYMDAVRNKVVDIVYDRMSNEAQFDELKDEVQIMIEEKGEGDVMTVERVKINEIWCTLVFRMLFWLQLHDFHQKDIQISKSDLYESRKPVYIV